MKTCGRCKQKLTLLNANKILTGKGAGSFQSYCKTCAADYARGHRAANPEVYIKADKKWNGQLKNKLKRARYKKNRKKDFPEKVRLTYRNSKLKKSYGILDADFRQLLKSQKGLCKICGTDISGLISDKKKSKSRACVDHCHKTGLIRGLLCYKCNFMLGHADDSPERLRSAANYLDKANQLK